MKLASPLFHSVIEIREGNVASLVIEDQKCFRELIADLALQTDGRDGKTVLSIDNKPVPVRKHMEMLSCFAPFPFSSRTIENKLVSAVNAEAVSETHWQTTARLLAYVERFLMEISEDLPCGIDCSKLSFEGILKSAGLAPVCVSEEPVGQVLEYMELVRALLGNRLFVAVNMRSWFGDKEMGLFINDVIAKKLCLLLVENCDRPRLPREMRWTVDRDLCEF